MIGARILRSLAIKSSVLVFALMGVSGAFGQQVMVPAPHDVVQLSASGSIEVVQDLLSLSLTTTRDGADASLVQSQLKAILMARCWKPKRQHNPGCSMCALVTSACSRVMAAMASRPGGRVQRK